MSFRNDLNIYKRAEKLSAAVFLVLATMPESSKIKEKIESLAIEMISVSSEIKDNFSYEKLSLISVLEKISLQLASFIDIASLSGSISQMNGDILKQEFKLFIIEMNKNQTEKGSLNVIPENFFNNNPQFSSTKNDPMIENSSTLISAPVNHVKKEIKDKYTRSQSREKAILDVLKDKNNLSIKDISRSIKGCSEKTIQRNLVSLLQGGIIKRIGERRWSKYSLS